MLETILNINLPESFIVIAISVLPIFELRASLPVAINIFQIPWYYAYLLAVFGTMLPVPFLLFFFEKLAQLLAKISIFEKMLDWLFARTRKRGGLVAKYGQIGLMLFVAIPLPVTGAWTGSLLAILFGIPIWKALIAIFVGVCIAGIIVTILSLMGWAGAIIAGVVLVGLASFSFLKKHPIDKTS